MQPRLHAELPADDLVSSERTGCRGGLGSADSLTLSPSPSVSHTHAAAPARRPLWAAAALLLCAAARGPAGREDTPKITVQALPRFEELRCLESNGHLEVQARLVDDVGDPLSAAPIELARGGAPVQALACGSRAARVRTLETDAAGLLCVRLIETPAAGSLTLSFRGDTLHLPAQAELALQPEAAAQLHLAFDAASLELNLDQPEQRLSLLLSGEGAASDALPAIVLQLEDGGQLRNVSTRGWLRSGNSLGFSVDSGELGAPGPARLLARVKNSTRPEEVAEAVALRSATVQLELAAVTPNADGVEVQLRAQSRAGVPSGGWIDLSLDEQPLASGPLLSGSASVQLPSGAAGATSLLARFHSDDPWWQPGEALPIDLGSPAPRGPARWPWLVLLVPIGYVCVRALQRPGVRQPRRAARRPLPRPPAVGRSGAAEPAPAGWSGTLIDAHDGRPIAGARVTASLPSLRDDARGESTSSDAYGRFALPPLPEPIPEGAQLVVSARLHSDFQRPLPPQGRVDISLTSRRRALLGRLVRWARAAGPPWHRGSEPTPGEIAIVALRRGEADTARWAEGVQAAAFDPADVDHERETAVRAGEPAWQNAAHSEQLQKRPANEKLNPTDRSS